MQKPIVSYCKTINVGSKVDVAVSPKGNLVIFHHTGLWSVNDTFFKEKINEDMFKETK